MQKVLTNQSHKNKFLQNCQIAKICFNTKGHSLCKQCLHDLQFMKKGSSSPNLSKLARADISCQFMKTRSLCRHCLQNEWPLTQDYSSYFRSSYIPHRFGYIKATETAKWLFDMNDLNFKKWLMACCLVPKKIMIFF